MVTGFSFQRVGLHRSLRLNLERFGSKAWPFHHFPWVHGLWLSRWWFHSLFFGIFTPKIGEDSHFDEYFSNVLFNHQLVVIDCDCSMASQPAPPNVPPSRNRGLTAGLIKGNQWVFISPDHKAGYSWGGTWPGGGRLTSHDCWHLILST